MSCRMILKHSKDAISEFLVEGSRLDAEALDSLLIRLFDRAQ